MVADLEAGVPGGDDLADRARAHDLADADRLDVRLRVVHPAAHRRVDRQVLHPDQELALAGLADRLFGVLPVAGAGLSDGTCG
jgi:hypothetical protein